MKFKRSRVEKRDFDEIIGQFILSQTTLKGMIEKSENSHIERHSEITINIRENQLLLESVLVKIDDLKSDIDEINKPWYKRIICL